MAVVPVALLALFITAASDDARWQRAARELDAKLAGEVTLPPPRVLVKLNGLSAPYQLLDVTLSLDGRSLAAPISLALQGEGPFTLYTGDVTPGGHTLVAQVTYTDGSSPMVSELSGYVWKVASRAVFHTERGLEVQVELNAESREQAREPSERVRLGALLLPRMTVPITDTTLPPPYVRPELAAADPVEAPPPVAAAEAFEPEPAPRSPPPPPERPAPVKRAKRTSSAARTAQVTRTPPPPPPEPREVPPPVDAPTSTAAEVSPPAPTPEPLPTPVSDPVPVRPSNPSPTVVAMSEADDGAAGSSVAVWWWVAGVGLLGVVVALAMRGRRTSP